MPDTLAQRLAELRASVDAELLGCGRPAGSVRIIGVSKKQPAAALREAVAAGLQDIGENYVQEAKTKFATLGPLHKALQRHFIGHIQTNKAKALVALFDVIQSVDRVDAARALAAAATAAGRHLPVLVQVNISPTERFGCPPQDAQCLAEAIREQPSLELQGVMAIGPNSQDTQEIDSAFALAAKTFAVVGGSTLSIGMSGDWRRALRAGSTMIRIGTALFGDR